MKICWLADLPQSAGKDIDSVFQVIPTIKLVEESLKNPWNLKNVVSTFLWGHPEKWTDSWNLSTFSNFEKPWLYFKLDGWHEIQILKEL